MGESRSIDTRLKSMLEQHGYPADKSVYTGKEKQYFVFNYATIPTEFCDDQPDYERYLIQIHLFAPLSGNLTALIRDVKNNIVSSGLNYPETTDASDFNSRHIVFETENVEAIDYV